MTKLEFFVTMKVTCEQYEWHYQTKEQIKQTAIELLQPNLHTIENGVKLKKVEVEFLSDDDINNNKLNFCPDGIFTE